MATLTINGYARRDGKFPVTLSFKGGPNAFGGFYGSRHYNHIWTLAKVRDWASQKHVEVVNAHYLPTQPL